MHDPAILEHCDCNLPKFSESTVILSASEGGDRGGEMWVRNVLYTLTHDDRKMVVSPTGWLTDNVITAAQMLILQHFPSMSGLQPPTLQAVSAFQVHSGEFVQIVNIRNKHWCVVPSASEDEDEDTGNDMWVRNLLYLLIYQDQKVVKSRGGWLTDQVISATQMIMLQSSQIALTVGF